MSNGDNDMHIDLFSDVKATKQLDEWTTTITPQARPAERPSFDPPSFCLGRLNLPGPDHLPGADVGLLPGAGVGHLPGAAGASTLHNRPS